MMKNQNKSSRILLKPCEWDKYGHFVHCMQYWYWVTSTVLNNTECEYICSTPKIPWKRPYVEAYLDRVLLELPNLKIVTEHSDEGLEFCHRDSIKDYFLHNDAKLKHVYRKWFPYDNSDSVRRIFVDNLPVSDDIKIGIVNRKCNRRILNIDQLVHQISSISNVTTTVTYFEDKDFNYQINFFNNHNVIISPHGAQLCSIPFMKPGSLVVECAHEEWHPYDYFPGLSYTSNMYHAMVVDDHACFPANCSDQYINPVRGRSNNAKLDIEVDIDKIVSVINDYTSGNMVGRLCNLY